MAADSKPPEAAAASAASALPAVDYRGAGLYGLCGSILGALGAPGEAGPPALRCLDPGEIAETRRLVLIVVDGLGLGQLRRDSPGGVLCANLRAPIGSVFPPTTASAVTTLLTGRTPAEHGLTGWFTWSRRHRRVILPLPYRERGGGALAAPAAEVFRARALGERLAVPSWLLQPRDLLDSVYSRHHGRGSRALGYDGVESMFELLRRVLRRERGALYAYAYWPVLDTLAHDHGSDSAPARAALRRFERAFEHFLEGVRGLGATVLVSADHGFVDTDPGTRIALADHPQLGNCLARPLCGEPRVAYCHLRRGAESEFADYVDRHLAHACTRLAAPDLIAQGVFGPGQPHPELVERTGDQVLLMRGRHALFDRLAGEAERVQCGVHGGTSAAEMTVPLVACRP